METERPPIRVTKEELAIVLDFLPYGYAYEQSSIKNPIAQALGEAHLTLLELIPKKEIHLQPHQEVYIGEGRREQIHHIKGRIPADKLTSTARNELQHAVEYILDKQESKFIEFFNKAQPLSMRMHQLELLPGLGKKHMMEIVEARKVKLFENFEDLKSRVKLLPDPRQSVVKRIISELEGNEKYKVFVG